MRTFLRILTRDLDTYTSQGWTPVMGETLPAGIDVVLIERVVAECQTGNAPVDKQGQEPDIEQ